MPGFCRIREWKSRLVGHVPRHKLCIFGICSDANELRYGAIVDPGTKRFPGFLYLTTRAHELLPGTAERIVSYQETLSVLASR